MHKKGIVLPSSQRVVAFHLYNIRVVILSPALCGPIPAEFGNTSYMEVLNVSNNLLAGKITPKIGSLSCIKVLDLSNNILTGSIPSVLGALVNDAVLVQGNTMITGQNKNDKISPLSVCSTVPRFDLFHDSSWCSPKNNLLREFYRKSKGQEWMNLTSWVDKFNNHCE
eukprot:7842670-Ditylum_brightwellii.AAC.1